VKDDTYSELINDHRNNFDLLIQLIILRARKPDVVLTKKTMVVLSLPERKVAPDVSDR